MADINNIQQSEPTLIGRNSDLNTYKVPGNYYTQSAEVSASIRNIPQSYKNSPINLLVLKIDSSGDSVVQYLWKKGEDSLLKYRMYIAASLTWGGWEDIVKEGYEVSKNNSDSPINFIFPDSTNFNTLTEADLDNGKSIEGKLVTAELLKNYFAKRTELENFLSKSDFNNLKTSVQNIQTSLSDFKPSELSNYLKTTTAENDYLKKENLTTEVNKILDSDNTQNENRYLTEKQTINLINASTGGSSSGSSTVTPGGTITNTILNNLGTPDVNLILEYSSQNSGCQGMCYLSREVGSLTIHDINDSNNVFPNHATNTNHPIHSSLKDHDVYAVFEPLENNQGRIIIIDETEKKVVRTGRPLSSVYHGNSLTCTIENGKHYIYISTAVAGNSPQNTCVKYSVADDAIVSDPNNPYQIKGGNISYDPIAKVFYAVGGSNDTQNKGTITKYATLSTSSSAGSTINLREQNKDLPFIVDIIDNANTQGCTAYNKTLYQLYFYGYNILVAFNDKGKYIKHWNLPKTSNYCKTLDQYQDITYNPKTNNFVISCLTRSERASSPGITSLLQIGLQKNLVIKEPSRLSFGEGTGSNYTDGYYTAYIETGYNTDGYRLNSNGTGRGNIFSDCSPSYLLGKGYDHPRKKGNIFRTIRDADYAFQQYHTSGGKIRYIIQDSRTSGKAYLSGVTFYKNCIVECGSTNTSLQIRSANFGTSSYVYIKGKDSSHPTQLYSGGACGWQDSNNKTLYIVPNGTTVILDHVKMLNMSTDGTVVGGFYVEENGILQYKDTSIVTVQTVNNQTQQTVTDIPIRYPVIFTPNQSNITVNSQKWDKKGNFVIGNINFNLKANFIPSPTGVVIGQIYSYARPESNDPYTGNVRYGDLLIRSSINADGKVKINSSSEITANEPIYASFSYVI